MIADQVKSQTTTQDLILDIAELFDFSLMTAEFIHYYVRPLNIFSHQRLYEIMQNISTKNRQGIRLAIPRGTNQTKFDYNGVSFSLEIISGSDSNPFTINRSLTLVSHAEQMLDGDFTISIPNLVNGGTLEKLIGRTSNKFC
jgi:hypothetical protein